MIDATIYCYHYAFFSDWVCYDSSPFLVINADFLFGVAGRGGKNMVVKQRLCSLGITGIIRNIDLWMFTIFMMLNGQRKWFLSYSGNFKNIMYLEKSTPKPQKCPLLKWHLFHVYYIIYQDSTALDM